MQEEKAGALQAGGTGSEPVGQKVVMQEERTGILQAGGTDQTEGEDGSTAGGMAVALQEGCQ